MSLTFNGSNISGQQTEICSAETDSILHLTQLFCQFVQNCYTANRFICAFGICSTFSGSHIHKSFLQQSKQKEAVAHSSSVVVMKLMKLQFQLVRHPPFSPALVSSDYSMFPLQKNGIGERDSIQQRMLLGKWIPILCDWTKSIIRKPSRNWNSVGLKI